LLLVFYKDVDGDGYTDGTMQIGCTAPAGYVLSAKSGDCNDNDPNINPGKAEICDGKDNNCNNQIDEGVLLVFYKDSDKDGYTDGTTKVSCSKPSDEYVSSATSGDCNDNDPNMNPGKTEICDNKDNNCNGQIDEGFNVGQSCSVGVGECARTGQYVCKADGTGTECNATPGKPTAEICDGKDNNCNGQIDEGNVCGFAKTIGSLLVYSDRAYSIIQSSDGGYVVAGYTGGGFGAGGYDFYVVKLDSSGNVQWTKTIGGSYDDVANSIIQSSDGGYVVAGWTESFGAGYYPDIYVVKLDSSGNVLWTKTIGGSGLDYAWSIIRSSDGGYVVAGHTSSFGASYYDIYVVKLDSSGNVIWSKTIGGTNEDNRAFSITQSSDGGYVVAGFTTSSGIPGEDIYVVKLDANGNACFSKNITNYSVSSNVGSFSSPSTIAIFRSPTVNTVSPTVSSGGSVKDVCPLASSPHLNICSASQDCDFGSAISTNRENVKSYGCSAGSVFSRFLSPASMLIIYVQLRRKKKKKKG
jgi:hypothetical protein